MKKNDPIVKRWFSEKEAAIYLGVSIETLRVWRNDRLVEFRAKKDTVVKGIEKPGKKILYSLEALDAAVNSLFRVYPTDQIRK